MVYNLLIRNDDGVQKQFYLTGDSEASVIRRAIDTYKVPGDRITLVEYFKEIGTCEIDHTPIAIREKKSKKDQKKIDQATELFYGSSKKRGNKKLDYIKKYGFKEQKISSPEELSELMSNYKKVKCYWEPSDKRGEHQYYALYK